MQHSICKGFHLMVSQLLREHLLVTRSDSCGCSDYCQIPFCFKLYSVPLVSHYCLCYPLGPWRIRNMPLLNIWGHLVHWCSSVDWAPACEPRGRWFDSQSGHKPVFQALCPVEGAWEATTHWCFSPSLPPSFPLSLKMNKYNILNKYLRASVCQLMPPQFQHQAYEVSHPQEWSTSWKVPGEVFTWNG